MAEFIVAFTNKDCTNGFGPVRVSAADAEAAVAVAAASEQRTLAQLDALGLTVRLVEAV